MGMVLWREQIIGAFPTGGRVSARAAFSAVVDNRPPDFVVKR